MQMTFKILNKADTLSLKATIADLLLIQRRVHGVESSAEYILKGIENALDNTAFTKIFYVEKDGIICGVSFGNIGSSIAKAGNYIWINELFVSEEYRRKGLAVFMLRELIAWCKNHNIKGIELETAADNEPAINLYRRFHFTFDQYVLRCTLLLK